MNETDTSGETRWLDDRYLDGLWYDGRAGDFCQFARGDGVVEMVDPETGEVYHKMEQEEWEPAVTRVPQEAVDDPETMMEDFIDEAIVRAQDWPMPQYVALLFANENTTVRATEDYDYDNE